MDQLMDPHDEIKSVDIEKNQMIQYEYQLKKKNLYACIFLIGLILSEKYVYSSVSY